MERPLLLRGISLRSAIAINVATMIGAGPLITIPLIVTALHGSVSVWAWVAGAAVALCDGLVYAELASRYPRSGGSYVYLREAFGPHGAGRLLAFTFVWQFLFVTPLLLASGYIGFAQYAGYLWPAARTPLAGHALAIAVGVVTVLALYRTIPRVAHTAQALAAIAALTLIATAACGLVHPALSFAQLAPAVFATHGFGVAAFGAALVITLYDYGGYNEVAQLGDEVHAPLRTIPRAIVVSVLIVMALYLALNLGVVATLPLRVIESSTFVASLAVERVAGPLAAGAVTILVLVTAFASTYGLLLGGSRVPFAAALEGDFLPAFARVHERKRLPHVSLLALGLLALPFTLVPLDAVINALTAGIVLIQGVGGNLALVALRRRGEPAPYRLPLYPLPVLVASGAWLYLFWSSGPSAMLFGCATLAVGSTIFLVRARMQRIWPFALAAAAVVFCALPQPARAATFTHARVVQSDGRPQLEVDGKPFFFFGGAFFYERIPPERWRTSMLALRALGANTLDLYVPWNWHEPSDGVFDFDGHTNPRRNLRAVLRLARELGFHLIVRPGPVIRNEWRNGGYPAWLLERPAYGMPLHDVLEGRYPAIATLQNAHSDDAADEWLHNRTHLRYAARWLHAVLHEFVPYADLVLAVQLDDDQGAYIDNQTWPAPHLRQYLGWLDHQVRAVVGPTLPTFINTYDMKVPDSAPVWAMANWYQSDAYRIGEHDRAELALDLGTLATQERVPLAVSEFQAGWLAAPEDPQPRPADPSNTTLALAEMLSWGVHGVVDFPLQDTLAPFGWDAPFANDFYAWDAAVPRDPESAALLGQPARSAPTARFGREIARWGRWLAATHRVADLAIADEVSASDPRSTDNDAVATIAGRLADALRTCENRGLVCDVVDLRFSSAARLRSYRTLVVPPFVRPPVAAVDARLAALRRAGVEVLTTLPDRHGDGMVRLTGGGVTFGVAANWSDRPRRFGSLLVPPRDARLVLLSGPPAARAARGVLPPMPLARIPADWAFLNRTEPVRVALPPVVADRATVTVGSAFGRGDPTVTLANARVVAIVVPGGGGRLVVFQRRVRAGVLTPNAVDATGALRDDVLLQPPPSRTDRIAQYTHSYPAGTAQRSYRLEVLQASGPLARIRLSEAAPDLLPRGARFVKTISLAADAQRLVVDERVDFPGDRARRQRAVTRSALTVPGAFVLEPQRGFVGWRDGFAVAVSWRAGEVARARFAPLTSNGTLTLTFAGGALRTTYALGAARTRAQAMRFAQAEQAWLTKPVRRAGEVAKR